MDCRLFLWGRSRREAGSWRKRLFSFNMRHCTSLNRLDCGRSGDAFGRESSGSGLGKVI
jgi:hypothetical protein